MKFDTGGITESGLNNSSAKWIQRIVLLAGQPYGATAGTVLDRTGKFPMTTNQACA
jgi:hypothetical protein